MMTSENAKCFMAVYGALSPPEQAKLESIDTDIFRVMIEVEVANRPIWDSAIIDGQRKITFNVARHHRPLLAIPADEFVEMSTDTIIAAVRAATIELARI